MRQEALEAGMQEVMRKPAQPLALESILQQFVFKAEAKKTDNHETAVVSNDVTAELTIIDWDACVRMFKGDPNFVGKNKKPLCKFVKIYNGNRVNICRAE